MGSAPTDSRPASDPKKSRDLRPLRMLFPYALKYKTIIGLALVALVTATLATLAVPVAVRRLIDNGMGADAGLQVNLYFGAMVLVVAVLSIASAGRYYFVTILGERVVSDVRRDVLSHLLSLSISFFDRNMSGEIMSRLSADTTQVKAAVGATASIALRNLFLFLGASIAMIVTSPGLSAIVLGAIPIIVLPIIRFGKNVKTRSRLAQDTLADASAFASEQIGAVRTVQSFTAERAASKRFAAAVERAFSAARQAILARSMLTAFGVFMVFTSVVGVLWIGARAVVTGDMTPGELGQFVLFAVFAAGALGELSQVWGEITLASGASERLAELLQMESDVPAPSNPVSILPEKRGSIVFDDVSFSYPNRPDETVVSSLSFSVEPGETVALVGPSGAGKSTIFQLLERFYDVDDGAVKIGGVDVRDLALKDLRDQFAMVPQQSEIFAASVSENLRFARPSATRDEIERAAHDAHIASFVEPMSEGYDTLIGERGLTLSAGQRQRIAIARAILRDAPILLLDEATSALDAESEALIQKSIARISQDRTTLIIAHRLATVRSADRILVLGSGGIIEEGSHQSLMARDGQYAKFARLQFLDWSNDNEVLSAAGS